MANLHSTQGDEPVFTQRQADSVLILTLIEDPTKANYNSRQFEYNRLYKQLDESPADVIFDMTACRMLDSVTIGMLVSLSGVCRRHSRKSVLCGVSSDVAVMLTRPMLLQPDNKQAMWDSYPTNDEAFAALLENSDE